MSDKNLTLALRRVRKSVRTNVDTGLLPPKNDCGPSICRPTSCSGGTGYAAVGQLAVAAL